MPKKQNKYNLAIFILSHGRPNNIYTLESLRKSGNTYPVFIIIDNHDKQGPDYQKKYKEQVIVFDKDEIAKTTDHGDNFNNLRTTTHVRNAIFQKAKEMGFEYFLALDDDYTGFHFTADQYLRYSNKSDRVKNFSKIIDLHVDYFNSINCLTICFAQGGDFIGGEGSSVWKKKLSRKAMNSWFCSTKRPFQFISRLNEDVNTCLTLGMRGGLFLTNAYIRLEQKATQATSGGMTEAYLEGGTYVKSFYSVMYCPSFVKIKPMGVANFRLHHKVNWNCAVPKIVSEDLKK